MWSLTGGSPKAILASSYRVFEGGRGVEANTSGKYVTRTSRWASVVLVVLSESRMSWQRSQLVAAAFSKLLRLSW